MLGTALAVISQRLHLQETASSSGSRWRGARGATGGPAVAPVAAPQGRRLRAQLCVGRGRGPLRAGRHRWVLYTACSLLGTLALHRGELCSGPHCAACCCCCIWTMAMPPCQLPAQCTPLCSLRSCKEGVLGSLCLLMLHTCVVRKLQGHAAASIRPGDSVYACVALAAAGHDPWRRR